MPDRHPAEPLFVLPDPKPEAFTEARLLSMLRSRYSGRAGNGPRWAFVTHVRDAAGFNATRTIDAIAVDTWPSSGIALHGFEVKTSRGDWRSPATWTTSGSSRLATSSSPPSSRMVGVSSRPAAIA